MAFNFFGVYFEDGNGFEYRCGFYNNNDYMPTLEKRISNKWVKVTKGNTNESAINSCIKIRKNLPIQINFPKSHTQNERMELINQIVYNINRNTTERVNYRGAHR